MNSLDNILAKLPTDTKIVRFVTKEGTTEDSVIDNELNITGVEVSDLSSVALPNLVACNVILNCFLACFGVDVASIARSNVDIGDYRLVDMQNLLINSKWDTTNMTIGGVTKTAYEWVKYRFHIYSKENFINQLYNRINDTCLKGKVTGGDSIISVDSDTYQMIKFIAMCFGANVGFSSIPLGNSETIHVEFDGWHFYEMLDKIGEVLEAEGYIADKTQVVHNQALGQWLGNSIDWTDSDNPVFTSSVQCTLIIHKYANAQIGYGTGQFSSSYVGVFPYGQGEDVWFYEILISDSSYGNVRRIEYGEASRNGDCINAGNIYGQTGNNSWYYPIKYSNLVIYDDNDNVISLSQFGVAPWWDIKCCRYYTMGYTGNILAQTTNYSYGCRPYNADIELSFYLRPSNERLLETPYPIYSDAINTLAPYEYSTPMIGNEGDIVHEEVVPEPTVDHTILDDIDDIDMISSGWFKRITLGIDSLLEALRTRSNFYDTTVSLKTDMIKTSTYKSIRTGIPLYNAKEDVDLNYITKFSSAVPYSNNAQKYQLNLSQRTYVLSEVGEINNFNTFLWDKDFADKILESLNKYTPLDCISDAITLPFDIKEEDMSEQHVMSCGGWDMTLPNAEAKGKTLINYIRVLRTEPVPIGLVRVAVEGAEETGENNAWIPDSFLNYEPYTTATVYIPFIGERKLDMSLIMYKWIYLEYKVFVPTGDFIVSVYAYDSNDLVKYGNMSEAGVIGVDGKMGAYPVITAQGNMAYHHKLAGSSQSDGFKALTSGISMVAGAFVGNPMSTLMGGANAANSMSGINHMQTSGSSFGNMTALLANWNAYITIFKHEAIRGYTTDTNTAFNQTIGKKSERGIKIKHMGKGFHKVKGVRLEGLNAPSECKEELIRILENGFYKASDPDGTIGD